MEHWQFLIQKQGARSWHILESPNLEISEGQYRVLARSNFPNTDVEVRVTHASTQEVQPTRRIFKRSRRTNSEGLMAVIPFTYFESGVWELRCTGDLMSDLLGKSWQYSVQLQVSSQEGEQGKNVESNSPDHLDSVSKNLECTVTVEPAIALDEAIAASTELAITTDRSPTTIVDKRNLECTALVEPVIALDKAIAISTELAITTYRNPTTTVLLDETEEDINEPVSPVWLRGETAEQILQNLIDLALPASEAFLNDEKVTDSPATQPPPPLLLTLGQDTYIARWGQPLTINGHIQLKENINLDQTETLFPKSLRAVELGIELRSPLESEILTKVIQPLPDQELPFTINTSIDIPADFESKLILADISLYGRFADGGEVIQLASQSFTITADVTELLAITTAAAKPSTSLSDPISSPAFTEPEAAVRIDLQLFNLAKIPKTDQSQILNPSPNIPLPPQINLQVLQETTLRTSNLKNSGTSPQLPKLPPVQTDVSPPIDVVVEPSTQEEILEKDATVVAINLEQLVIRQRRMPILETTFPFLRRRQALPGNTEEEVKNDVPLDVLEVQAAEDFPRLDTIVVEDEKTPEVEAQPNTQFQEESVAEVEAQQNAQFLTTGNLYSSPLLRKWMQSQGYFLPESINHLNDLQPQDYANYVPAQQTQLSFNAETPNIDVNLPFSLDGDTETWQEVQEAVFDLGDFGEDADTVKEADLEIKEDTGVEKLSEPTLSLVVTQLPPPPPPIRMNIATAWLAQEIVVDDTHELESDTTKNYSLEEEKQPLLSLSSFFPITTAAIEPLPIPQLHVPDGELIAGKFIIVRVVLPEVAPQVVVKLWVEDYQTRWLLEGPHLLANLLPNALGGLEVMTQLNIPFGCLEIRLEAIALNLITQQESHKVTIVRTVIPPDLPSLQLDELLGM